MSSESRTSSKSDTSTSSISSSNSDSKQKKQKSGKNQKTTRDWILKFVTFGVLPLLLLLVVLKSNWIQNRSEQSTSSGEIKVKTTEVGPANTKPPVSLSSNIPVQQINPDMQDVINGNISSSTAPLRIQIASDLHIEFFDKTEDLNFLIEPQAPILALLGDIGYACTEQLRNFLLSQCNRFEQVWFLAGNHEYYNHGTKYSVTEQHAWLQQVASERPNLHFLEKAAIPMLNGSIIFLATTLWSDIPDSYLRDAEKFLNDYHLSYNHGPTDKAPRLLRANETREWYRQNLNWLQSQLQVVYEQNKLRAQQQQQANTTSLKEPQTKVVVLTHHTPLMTGTSAPQYEGTESTHCFSSDLAHLLTHPYSPIEVWACGHTHYNFDLSLSQTNRTDDEGKAVRVVSNQRGYQNRPKPDYQPNGVVLEIHPSIS